MRAHSSFVLTVLGCLSIFLGTSATLAQTSSANSSDFAGFVPPGTNGATVNEVTGAFNYSRPLIVIPNSEGEAYTLTLDYHTPAPDEEASWVGLGWRLSPGAISRTVQGYPDDYCGDTIVNINKVPTHVRNSMRGVYGAERASVSSRIAQGSVWDSQRGVSQSYNTAVGVGVIGYSSTYAGSEFGAGGSYSEQFSPIKGIWNSASLAASLFGLWPDMPTGKNDWLNVTSRIGMNYAKIATGQGFRALSGLAGKKTNNNGKWWDGFNRQMRLGMPVHQSDVSTTIYPFSASAQFNMIPLVGDELGVEGELIITNTKPFTKLNAYGYMHSGKKGLDDNNAVMDFQDDKIQAIDRNDKFISMPIAMPDVFNAASQGIGGTFKVNFSQPGHFVTRKPSQTYEDQNLSGIEADGGLSPTFNVGLGASFVKSKERWLKLQDWSIEDNGQGGDTPLHFSDKSARVFFAFSNDPTGFRKYGKEDGVIRPKKEGQKAVFGNGLSEIINPYTPNEFTQLVRHNTKADYYLGHSSPDAPETPAEFNRYKRFEKNSTIAGWINTTAVGDSTLIEFQILDSRGQRHNYGLPVYARNQFNLSFSLMEDKDAGFSGNASRKYDVSGYEEPNASSFFKDHHIIDDSSTPDIDLLLQDTKHIAEQSNAMIAGTLFDAPVANEFLLTSLLGANYVDVTGDGPTDDDLGSWVKFEYERPIDWFKFRLPHKGAYFSRGQICDPRDDKGAVSGGEKQVYEITAIETKSHRAEFFRSAREDGHSAPEFHDPSGSSSGTTHQLCRLDRIEIKTKGSSPTLLETIHFEYDYSLCPGFPGNPSGGGKLTLKSIHSTYGESVEVEDRFEFEYEYPDASALAGAYDELPSLYTSMLAEYDDQYDSGDQNPAFSGYSTDAWGSIAPDPNADFWDQHEPWISPTEYDSGTSDPAAYFLKQIHSPSGLTLLPQFERGDYSFCSDQRALIMTPVSAISDGFSFIEIEVNLDQYFDQVTTADPDVDLAALRTTWEEFYQDHFRQNDQLLLLSLMKVAKDNGHAPQANRKRFFDMFATVASSSLSGNVLTLSCVLDEGASMTSIGRDWQLANPNVTNAFSDFNLYDKGDVARGSSVLFYQTSNRDYFDYPEVEIDLAHTYARIPVPHGASKRGGAVRLKRLLQLDRGISLEDGDAMMFGTEYRYTKRDPVTGTLTSSGVASNEPNSRSIEHPHMLPLPKRPQSANQRLLAGEDLERLRGPIGSSFFPAPTVTYEQVTKLFLHPYNDVNEFEVANFFSHRTDPLRIEWSNPDNTQWERPCCDPEEGFLSYKHRWELSFAQGFKVIKSAFPGLEISRMRYFGDIEDATTWTESTGHRNFYLGRRGDSEVPTLNQWTLKDRDLGRWEELYVHGRLFHSFRKTVSHELDLNVSWPMPWPPGFLPIPTWIRMTSEYREIQSTLASTHVVTLPARLRKVVSTNTGKTSTVEHLAFDQYTGSPTTTTSTDGFLDEEGNLRRIISHAVPSSHIHDEMGPASVNDRKVMYNNALDFSGVAINKIHNGAYLEILPVLTDLCTGISGVNLMDYFYPGDLIKIFDDTNPYEDPQNDDFWVVTKVQGNNVFIDPAHHLPYLTTNRCNVNVEIIQSGRTNQLDHNSLNYAVADAELDWRLESNFTPEVGDFIDAVNGALSAVSALPTGTSPTVTPLPFNPMSFLELDCSGPGAEQPFQLELFPNDCQVLGAQMARFQVGSYSEYVHVANPAQYGEVGHLEWSDELGAIIYVTPDNPCNFVQLFTPCEDLSQDIIIDNVISAMATPKADTVDYEGPSYAYKSYGELHADGLRGRWHEQSMYSYNDSTSSLFDGHGIKSQDAGIMSDMVAYKFHRQDIEQEGWISTMSSEVFSLDGVPIEQSDALDAKTGLCFGHEDRLLLWTLFNAGYDEAYYQSFEDWENPGTKIFNGGAIKLSMTGAQMARHNNNKSHSGQMSYQLVGSSSVLERYVGSVKLGESALQSGLRLRFWAHHPTPGGVAKLAMDSLFTAELEGAENGLPYTDVLNGSCTSPTQLSGEVDVIKLASTGEWSLYQAMFDSTLIANGGYTLGDQLDVILRADFAETTSSSSGSSSGPGGGSFGGSAPALAIKTIYLDDIRIQPTYSAMKCSAYDPERLFPVAQFNENHFGEFFQYNMKNELIRKRIETLEGIKTTSEQYLHHKIN